MPAMTGGALEMTPASIRYSAIAGRSPGRGCLAAGLREIAVTEAPFEDVEAALDEGVMAVREAGVDRIGLFASGELRGTRVAGLLSVRAPRLGLGELRFTGTGAAIAADFVSRSEAVAIESGAEVPAGESCGVLGIGHHSVGLAVGSAGRTPTWIGSRPVGLARLAGFTRLADPPEPVQIEAARAAAERSLAGMTNPGFGLLASVSDFSRSTRLVCGEVADAESLGLALDSVTGMSADELGARVGLGPVLAPLFPLALAVQLAAARTFSVGVAPLDPDPAALEAALAGTGTPEV